MPTVIENNASVLTLELEWLKQLIDLRLRLYFNDNPPFKSITEIPVPAIEGIDSTYSNFIRDNKLDASERILLILSLAPYIKPEILDAFFARNTTYDKKFSEFGGVASAGPGFIPTGETALFLLAGDSLKDRFVYYRLLTADSLLIRNKIVWVDGLHKSEPHMHGRLSVTDDYAEYFITGHFPKPHFGESFPAKLVTTELEWQDVVHGHQTAEGLMEIRDWIEHGNALLNGIGLGKRLKPGYKSLFYGPPGTGKTLTACLLGKSTGHDVYKIDLALIVSKYIGETEKNLSRVFDKAENKGWILFFDEADALFGQRTEINSSNDRFANQEVAYLLQRIEDYNGIVILASNLKDNIDKAFTRRFQSVIHFPMPGVEERYSIWRHSFSEKIQPAKEVDLRMLAQKYAVSGGVMMNVIRYSTLKALRNKKNTIPLADIENGIRRELQKDGIILT